MFLAWTREFIGALLGAFGASREGDAVKTTSIVFAVIMVYVLDFSVNVIQAGIRAFIVDNAPLHQQDTANAWANRMSNVGNIILYVFGYIDLPRHLWFFGNTQFKVLCVIASVGLMITVLVSCFSIQEKSYRQSSGSKPAKGGVLTFFKTLFHSIRYLPRQIKRVCQVQLAAWIGWFPFLFYGSTYIGEIYVDPIFRENPNMTPAEVDTVWEQGTRIGTFALLIFAVTSLVASIVIPWFIVDPYKQSSKPTVTTPLTPAGAFPIASTEPLTDSHGDYFGDSRLPRDDPKRRHITFFRRFTRHRFSSKSDFDLTIPGLTLRRAWLYSLLMFALLMLLTFAARSTTAATILVAFIGIPWSITMWAPFALIAAEVRKRDALRNNSSRTLPQELPSDTNNDSATSSADQQPAGEVTETGLILGIHNVAVSAPQVVATLISAGIFQALEKPRGQAGDGSVAWVLRFGGVLALVAAGLTLRVADEEPLEDRDVSGQV
jgi:solute carrier family 45 protein 1/2/4